VDVLTITFVTASTALVSSVTGPVVSYIVANRQIRATVISNNRERWIEALRDSMSEYVALIVSAGMLQQATGQDPMKAIAEDHALLQLVERITQVKSKIMLMTNPNEEPYKELCAVVEATYQVIASGQPQAFEKIRTGSEEVTRAGRDVLKAEWVRVKRGD
jgi:hypothetical protein